VGDQDDRLADGDVEQLGDQPRFGLRAEPGRGFVEQQYRGVAQQRPGDGDAALLAAGQHGRLPHVFTVSAWHEPTMSSQ
jgi:hypothetical protein